MKKALKITGITLAILVGLVLIATCIAVAVLTSSDHLTKILKRNAPKIVNCETELEKADLTLFKTFPNVGIDVEHVALINPMEGSPSDTLANIDDLTLVMDIKKLLKKEIVVRQCILDKAFVNIYSDPMGNSNLNVFNTKKDTVATSSSFNYLVNLEEITLKNSTVFFTDSINQLTLQFKDFDMDLKGKFQDNDLDAELGMKIGDFYLLTYATPLALKNVNLNFNGGMKQLDSIEGLLTLDKHDVHLKAGGRSPSDDSLNITLPFQFSLNNMSGHFDQGLIAFRDCILHVDGDAVIAENGDPSFDLDVTSNDMSLKSLLTLLPKKLEKTLFPNGTKDKLKIKKSNVKILCYCSKAPVYWTGIKAKDFIVNVSSQTHPVMELDLDMLMSNDLSKKTKDSIGIDNLTLKLLNSRLKANGIVDDLTGDVLLKVNAKGDIALADVKAFLPNTMKLKGHTCFDINTDFTIDELKETLKDFNLKRLSTKAGLKFKFIAFDMDNLHLTTPQLDMTLVLPASSKQGGKNGVFAAIDSKAVNAQIGEHLNANLEGADIRLFADNFSRKIEDLKLDATINLDKLGMAYDTLVAVLNQSNLSLTTPQKKNSKGLSAQLTVNSGDAEAQLGERYALNTHSLGMNASVQQNKAKEGFLSQWNPNAELTLENAMVRIDRLGENIHVSNLNFFFEPNLLDFKNCTFRLGQSDVSIQGNVTGIKDQIEQHGSPVKGDFKLNTELLDIKEIVELINGLDITKDTTKSKDNGPFIVPKGIDLTLDLKTKKTVYEHLDFNDLRGLVSMKDNALTLHEISFTNKAARMQLSALYQSLSRDSLFFAMDFHLLDVQISDLLHLIPYFDTLVPMLKTFDGQGEVNLDVETNLWPSYQPKIHTMRAAADIKGQDLTVNDQFTFTKITDILHVSTNGEYRVDSLDVQLTFFKNQLDLWPSQLGIGRYKAIAEGYMTSDKYAEYHISITESPFPLHHGLKISGPFEKMKFELEESKHPNQYKPVRLKERNREFIQSIKKRIANRKAVNNTQPM